VHVAAGKGAAGCKVVRPGQSYIFRSTPGRENKNHTRMYAVFQLIFLVWRVDLFFERIE